MGIVLLPVFLIALVIWILCLIFCIRRIFQGNLASSWSYALAIVIGISIYSLVLLYWSFKKEIWVLAPYFTLPFTNIILPGAIGIGGVFVPKKYKIWNIIGFGFCMSALIAPVFLIVLDDLINYETFLNVNITY